MKTIHLDIVSYPILNEGKVIYFVSVFLVKKVYRGRNEIQRSREYLEIHWQEKFDLKKVAQAANLSPDHLSRLFQKHLGITPYRYYLNLKLDYLREFLKDDNLSIAEAFSACGMDYHGHFAKIFKNRTGFTPSEYRESFKYR